MSISGILVSIVMLFITINTSFAIEIQATPDDIARHNALQSERLKSPEQVENSKPASADLNMPQNAMRQKDAVKADKNSRTLFKPKLKDNVNHQIDNGVDNGVENGVENKAENRQVGNIDQQFRDLKILIIWGFVIIFSAMAALLGYIIWDRQTLLIPAIKRSDEMVNRQKRIERSLNDLAAKDVLAAETIRHYGIL
jgi:hypothetical protein